MTGTSVMLQLPGCRQARVAGDDHAVRADKDRIRPAKLDDAGRDLRHLLVGMGARVAGVGHQFVDGQSCTARSLEAR